MSVYCSLKNLNLSFGDKLLFDDASLVIEKGDKIGLIGLNGAGKSSLFKILTEKIRPDSTSNFIFDKASDKSGQEGAYSVFLVEQAFTSTQSYCSVQDYLFAYYPDLGSLHRLYQEAIASEDFKRQEQLLAQMEHAKLWDLQNQYESYLKSFGMKDLARDVNGLSGGEQKKILLALGLCSQANLVLWDEPTNHLDIESVKKLEDELMASSHSFVIISHDRHLLSKVCNKIFHIDQAKIREFRGSYAQYLEYLDVKEEKRLAALTKLKNTLKRETEWMRQGVKARGTRSKKRVEGYRDLLAKTQELKQLARQQIELNINESSRKTKKLIELKNASLSFGDRTLFEGLNLSLFKGQKIGVLGPNGIGKTSLMRVITKEIPPSEGSVFHADGIKINFFDQKREELNLGKTPYELLGEGEDFIHFADGRSLHVSAYFQNFLFDKDQLKRPLSSFSGGELNRLQLAVNLKNESDVWIFDEPTNDLDIESIEILEQKLAQFEGTLLLISHDRSFLENVTNCIWLFDDRKIEVFASGYSQTQAYLDALEIEKSLQDTDDEPSEPSQAQPKASLNDSPSFKLSNAQKERLKKLPSLIAAQEAMLEQLEVKIEAFDYSQLDDENSQRLNDLVKSKERSEEELLSLYEELEELGRANE